MARKDIEGYLNDLHSAGISDQALVNQYAKSLEAGIAIPRHIKDADLIRRLRALAKKFDSDIPPYIVTELIYCLQAGVPEEYIISGLDFEQLGHIRAGYKEGVNVSIYADPKNPGYLMFGARKLLKSGIPENVVRDYMRAMRKRIDSINNYNTMCFEEVFRWYIEDGGDIKDVEDILSDEYGLEKMKHKRAALKKDKKD